MTIFAPLDSMSVSGAYKFVISAGYNTITDVQCTLFPRSSILYAGVAPLTIMFYFAPSSSSYRTDDARPRVHDSDGLSISNGKGERIWRPLINPKRVQFSEFADGGLKGFGFLQRERRADRYQDFDASYESPPSVWVEPEGSWDERSVDLVELPAGTEYFDDIVAFWHPKKPLQAGGAYTCRHRLTRCQEPPLNRNFATVAQTLAGASNRHEGMRQFYIDFARTEEFHLCDHFDDFYADKNGNMELSSSTGNFVNIAIRRNRISGGHRAGFEHQPAPGSFQADLRCAHAVNRKPVSELWVYHWTD